MKIGLIGKGNLGKFLLDQLNVKMILPDLAITALFDEREKSRESLKKLAATYQCEPFYDLTSFLNSPIDLVVECATVDAVYSYAPKILQKKDMVVVSIGALADISFYEKIEEITKAKQTKLYLPAGAIGGLDAIQAASIMGGLESVTLMTRKPAKALGVESEDKFVLFDGPAKEAIQQFPQNANVAITLSLAGLGVEKTRVRIIADPAIKQNIHTIQATGEFGNLEFTFQNYSLPTNPKTSYLTALSLLSTLKSLNKQIQIG